MKNNFLSYSSSNIYARPSSNSELTSQILYGEKFNIISRNKKWIKIKTSFDNYTGYVKKIKYKKKI